MQRTLTGYTNTFNSIDSFFGYSEGLVAFYTRLLMCACSALFRCVYIYVCMWIKAIVDDNDERFYMGKLTGTPV